MEINITPENSKIFRVYDIDEIEGSVHDDILTIILYGEEDSSSMRMKLRITLDANGCNGFRVAISSMVGTGARLIQPDTKLEYGCHYMLATIENTQELVELSFLKVPAITINDKCGKYDELDDCAVFMRRSKEYDYQYLHIIIPTINSTINAFVDAEYIVFEFGMSDKPETRFSWMRWCYTTLDKFRAALDQKFPFMANAEFNRHCYGYCKSSERG